MLIEPLAELGLVAMDGPNDPEPSLVIEDGRVVELDGRRASRTGTRSTTSSRATASTSTSPREAAALDDVEIARRLVDVDVPRAELVRLSRGLTPARLARVIAMLDPVELMFALKKLRARRAPANQAHVTNLKENPALLAADAAEAAARGFAELETTVGVSRYAPLNAIAILVGSQTGRPGVMTQCAVEERLNLRLAIQGLVTYAETLSVYGTEAGVRRRRRHAVVEGVPRLGVRVARRQGALHVRRRLRGADGRVGGQVDALPRGALPRRSCARPARRACRTARSRASRSRSRVPGGTREVLAENVLAAWLDLEVASGNDAIASHSEIRKTAKLMGQFLPGTDFVTSGYSSMPRYDNMFGGGNYDSRRSRRVADDAARLAGRRRASSRSTRTTALAVRERAARAVQAVFDELGFPPITRRGGAARGDVPRLARPARPRPRRRRRSPATACSPRGSAASTSRVRSTGAASPTSPTASSTCSASGSPPTTSRPRRSSTRTATVVSAVNDPNATPGPGTGYRLEGERWERLQRLPYAIDARLLGGGDGRATAVEDVGDARRGRRARTRS